MKRTFLFALVASSAVILSCTKDTELQELEETQNVTLKNAYRSSNTVNFTVSGGTGWINSESEAEDIFDNWIDGWDTNRARVSYNQLRTRINQNYGTSNGMECRINVSDQTQYVLEYDFKFEDGFEFAKGGKLGFGFAIGNGVTGCRADDARVHNKGGSFRLMWRTHGNNGTDAYVYPYVYFKGMPSSQNCGNTYHNNSYKFDIQSGVTYNVRMKIRVNSSTSSSNNGYGSFEIKKSTDSNYTKVWEVNNMLWTGNTSSYGKVKTLYYSTFRGGGDSSWNASSSGSQYIFYDNLKWNKSVSIP